VTHEVGDKIKDVSIHYTDVAEDMKEAEIIIVAVPTPVNENKDPDYTPLIKSSETIGKILQK
jgi:UDP-N-acetyl-D-glucosamine/UDP-N-acetyl-D-galactosamine dehydrogenase